MGEIIKSQVSNIPLVSPSTSLILTETKGCKFYPGVWLKRGNYYFVVVTNKPDYRNELRPGFYDVPDRGFLTWAAKFKLLQISQPNIAGLRCWVFEAFEGTPPKDAVPLVTGVNMGVLTN